MPPVAVLRRKVIFQKKRLPSRAISPKRILPAEVAQLVEQGTENPRVGSSILSLGTIKETKLLHLKM